MKETRATTPLRKEVKMSGETTAITNLIVSQEKLTAQLNDGRELSIPISWFAKWGIKGVNADKLRKYEIWEGDEIYFSEIDEVLGIEVFIYGFDAPCE